MTCEEFEMAGLDLGAAGAGSPLQEAARAHLQECPHCAALHESWRTLREELRSLGAETREANAPSRVEMRLRQEFRTEHKTLRTHRAAAVTAWALASAAVFILAITWFNWRQELRRTAARQAAGGESTADTGVPRGKSANELAAGPELGEVLVASNDTGEFTLLPGSMPGTLEDATVVRVQLQRGALGALGLTVNEERASDWIQVDLLVGSDGQPQAVRMPQSEN